MTPGIVVVIPGTTCWLVVVATLARVRTVVTATAGSAAAASVAATSVDAAFVSADVHHHLRYCCSSDLGHACSLCDYRLSTCCPYKNHGYVHCAGNPDNYCCESVLDTGFGNPGHIGVLVIFTARQFTTCLVVVPYNLHELCQLLYRHGVEVMPGGLELHVVGLVVGHKIQLNLLKWARCTQ